MRTRLIATVSLLLLSVNSTVIASNEDRIELETTIIKGNTELPKILYVVPWQDVTNEAQGQQKLVLHSLFGDFFDPQLPPPPSSSDEEGS